MAFLLTTGTTVQYVCVVVIACVCPTHLVHRDVETDAALPSPLTRSWLTETGEEILHELHLAVFGHIYYFIIFLYLFCFPLDLLYDDDGWIDYRSEQSRRDTSDSLPGPSLVSIVSHQGGITAAVSTPEATVHPHRTELKSTSL